MYCPKCHTEGKLIKFNTFHYWYCVNCKEEIQARSWANSYKNDEYTVDELQLMFEDLIERTKDEEIP